MIYNSVSCEVVIHKIYNDLNIPYSDWVHRVPEWCFNALREMNLYTSLLDCSEVVNIIDFKGKLPCDIQVLEGIEYENYALVPHHQVGKYYKPNLEKGVHPKETYEVNVNGIITTTFKEGTIIVYYKKIPTEYSQLAQQDLPLVPDNEQVLLALKWYCFTMMLGRGYIHPVFKYGDAESRWREASSKVPNAVLRLTRDERELHRLLWASFLVNQQAWSNAQFNNRG